MNVHNESPMYVTIIQDDLSYHLSDWPVIGRGPVLMDPRNWDLLSR